MQSDFCIRNIANVVHSWMGYLYEVSEVKHLAAESSLRYPIAGLLERKKAITNIQMEIEHPGFLRKRVDFYWETESTKNYMEMKYVSDLKVNIQKILNDVFRLALIDDEGARKYFLVCGKSVDFQKYFQMINPNESDQKAVEISEVIKVKQSGNNHNNALGGYFSFDNNCNNKIKTIELSNDEYYKNFKVDYLNCRKNDYEIPDKITIQTELMQSIDKGLESAVAIWKIEKIEDES